MNWTVLYICGFVIPLESLKFNDGYGELIDGTVMSARKTKVTFKNILAGRNGLQGKRITTGSRKGDDFFNYRKEITQVSTCKSSGRESRVFTRVCTACSEL